MKKLSRMLLIHWYSYNREVLEFGDINFLTGKTAAGKSTIIDALQLVLLGDTNGGFFNKAANEKSVRTLKSYLFGENGDDGETGFRYLRKGPFTSYVVLEYEDTENKRLFLTGIVCDCYEDLNYDYKWFVADRMGIPANLFTDEKTRIPFNIRQLRSWFKSGGNKGYEIIDTNKRYQEIVLAKYGSIKRKYLTLLKKSVPFTPITDIEKFITESVCDVKNNIRVEQMQSDIRQYKNLEMDAERTQKKIVDLEQIASLTQIYEAEKERGKQQDYIILRAEQEECLEKERAIQSDIVKKIEFLGKTERQLKVVREKIDVLRKEISKLEEDYYSSDLVRRQTQMEQQIGELEKEKTSLESGIIRAIDSIWNYTKEVEESIQKLRKRGIEMPLEAEKLCMLSGIKQKDLNNIDFRGIAEDFQNYHNKMKDMESEYRQRLRQLETSISELEHKAENLKNGIKPYPASVITLKQRIEAELFERYRKTVEIPVFADLLEIRDQEWRNAIEGYLDRQKFNLLVPEVYYRDSNEIYNSIRKEEHIYDAGLVDIGKLRKEFRKQTVPGSLAEEIETEYADARLYADYLLGSVMKCEDARKLNTFRIAITKNVMLYKGYVSRRLNPARYNDPFIGRRSMQILLERCERDLDQRRQELEQASNEQSLVKRAAECPGMSFFEAEQHKLAVKEAERIPELEKQLSLIKQAYEKLDLTFAMMLQEQIHLKRSMLQKAEEEEKNYEELFVRTDEQKKQLEEKELPYAAAATRHVRDMIQSRFNEQWIRETGEVRFQKELRQSGRTRLTLKESFERARTQTETVCEKHLKERRRKRGEYNQIYQMPYDIEREDNQDYDRELQDLREIRLPDYITKIKDAKEKAYNQFRDDFIAKLKSNIESVREQIKELNDALKNSVFGTDSYHFEMGPRAEYRSYYDMITDPMLMDTGGWNIASENFNAKYQREIDALFKALIVNETDVSAERRAEYERNIRKFTDYKTYLVFDLIVTNDQGEKQRLSKTLLKKSGGETQIPFYISLLASFSQVCRIRMKGKNNTIRVIILDEAFSKMDGERIRESIALLRKFELQAIFSAPPEKIPDIAPNVDRNIAVYKTGHTSFTRYFDPAKIEAAQVSMEP